MAYIYFDFLYIPMFRGIYVTSENGTCKERKTVGMQKKESAILTRKIVLTSNEGTGILGSTSTQNCLANFGV